jgi:hypothetical protein
MRLYSVYYISVGISTCFGCRHPSSGAGIAVITVVRARDDGCQHPKHVEMPAEIQGPPKQMYTHFKERKLYLV